MAAALIVASLFRQGHRSPPRRGQSTGKGAKPHMEDIFWGFTLGLRRRSAVAMEALSQALLEEKEEEEEEEEEEMLLLLLLAVVRRCRRHAARARGAAIRRYRRVAHTPVDGECHSVIFLV
ncbi:hypothetical protein VC83_06902 [Pseudogymnoascus destructans]|uniref:Uncharacterized protein n=1 Tax=Pseudogymnoascus destructans TaxID=655981 RepID=A0A177A7F8_9PEZI|nr:uncharacterized protein VC83_06902 [Pseudogymnoascus destructans]OAF56954.1 hypothetical protein VC83_06902 [Pseudogymnoascus destructans]